MVLDFACGSGRFERASCITFYVLGGFSFFNFLLVAFAVFTLSRIRKTHDVSKFRFISLFIVLVEMLLLTVHWVVIRRMEHQKVIIVVEMLQEIIKYIGFYYCVYFFTAQAVEILSNKDNDFIYYTKLGLISTSGIQIVHCIVTFVLISIREGGEQQFCRNNLWVMMRFLGLAVTLGFIFIGWRIQQSILNPLLNKKEITRTNKKGGMKETFTENLMERESLDNSGSMGESRISYISEYRNRFGSETQETIKIKIKMKKKQLRIMWVILYVILFICFFEMVHSGVQRLADHTCDQLLDSPVADSILIFFANFIGLLLWTFPLIYVYWGREYYASWRMRRNHADIDEEGENIEEYFKDKSMEKGNGSDGMQPQLITKAQLGKTDKLSDKSDDEDD